MFFSQIRRNAARNRKSNGLFFASLVIAVIAFYTLLSLGEQDVMRFLKTIESEAVRKLMLLIPSERYFSNKTVSSLTLSRKQLSYSHTPQETFFSPTKIIGCRSAHSKQDTKSIVISKDVPTLLLNIFVISPTGIGSS